MKTRKIIRSILAIVLIATFVISNCNEYVEAKKIKYPKIIVHAAGGINNKTYTNSKEALIKALKRGEKMIELDFMITTDNYIVCTHHWESTNGKRVSRKKFLSKKISGKYTPMSADTVVRLMAKYKANLIVDTKEPSFRKFYNAFMWQLKTTAPGFRKRVIPQIYFDQDYDRITTYYNFKSYIYTMYKQKSPKDKDYTRVAKFCKNRKVKIVTIPVERASKKHVKLIKAQHMKVAVHTVNDYDKILRLKKYGVDYIYTDYQSVKKLKKTTAYRLKQAKIKSKKAEAAKKASEAAKKAGEATSKSDTPKESTNTTNDGNTVNVVTSGNPNLIDNPDAKPLGSRLDFLIKEDEEEQN